MSISDPWRNHLSRLQERGLYRTMPEVAGFPGRVAIVNGDQALNFSSNNYLGLAGHPEVVRSAQAYAESYGVGATASRLIAGSNAPHRELEAMIARWKGTEAALTFVSGYQANVGILSALFGEGDLIISDALNHASIIDGCRLSRADVRAYPHCDMTALQDVLRDNGGRRMVVATESVFSMDGDTAPLREMRHLCDEHGALLMVDEAHATGLYGKLGSGLAEELAVQPDIHMGTLSKALGASGAYVAGSASLIELLTNTARSLIYTTAPPPPVIGAALSAIGIVMSPEGAELRDRLKNNVHQFDRLLRNRLALASRPSHIRPVTIGDSDPTMKVSQFCLQRGLFVHGIRYPTVPEGMARLRFTLMSHHLPEDLEFAVSTLCQALEHINLSAGRPSTAQADGQEQTDV
jgi:glycine C-acetyltransferase